MRRPDRPDPLDVGAGLDLQLDPHVPLVEVAADLLEEDGRRPRDPDADAAGNALALGSEPGRERLPTGSKLGVEEGVDHGRLRHRVRPHGMERSLDAGHVHVAGLEEQRSQEVPDRDPRAFVELPAEVGALVGDALPPALRVVGLDPDDHAPLVGGLAEARPERADERQLDQEQLERSNSGHRPGVPSTYAERSRSKPTTTRPTAKDFSIATATASRHLVARAR